MPNINDFLSGVFSGATHPKGTLGDFQHAARLYGDNLYSLTPKLGHLYYAFLVINPRAQTQLSAGSDQRTGSLLGTIGQVLGGANTKGIFNNGKNQNLEAGLLVKAADLPKFQIQTEQLNQYNRRTVVQTKIQYQPVTLNFHDDMSNVTNDLWQNYFRYYYADSTYASASSPTSDDLQNATNPAYANTKYSPTTPVPPNAYGLNNNQGEPFFKAIILYQINRHVFNSYIMVNPLITSWDHAHLDQTQAAFSENRMSFQYETVFYGKGKVRRDHPPGFATFHYDTTPSPLSIQGGGTGTLFGPGGVIAGAEELFGGSDTGPTSILGTALGAANLARNIGKLNSAGIQAEGYSILGGVLGTIGNRGNIPSGSPVGIGGGVVGGALSLFQGNNTSVNGSNNAAPRAVIAGGATTDSPGGATSQVAATGAVVAGLSPLDPKLLPTDVAELESLSAANQDQLSLLQTQISDAQSKEATYKTTYAQQLAIGGQAAADEFSNQYASNGYQDPAKLQANLTVLQNNQVLVETALKNANQTIAQNPTVAKDDNTQGPKDPNANLNVGVNADANVQAKSNSTTGTENAAQDYYDF
jgi:hypothetical protein